MSSTNQASDTTKAPPPAPSDPPQRPTLPPNVSIFSPADSSAAQNLLAGRLFTRLTISAGASASTAPDSRLAEALLRSGSGVDESFCLAHGRAALVFDAGGAGGEEEEGEEGGAAAVVEDAHHEHVRAVCLALRDADLGLDIAGCVFDAGDVLRAGFQLDRLKGGAVMVVDIMGGDEDDDDDDEDGSDLEGFLAGGMGGEVVG